VTGVRRRLREGQAGIVLVSLLGNPSAVYGLAVVLLFLGLSATAPLVAPYHPFEMHLDDQLVPPCTRYLLGTDEFGRDLLSRVIFGSRVSIAVSALSTAIALIIGAPCGLVAGYFGGKVDTVIMRLLDVLLAFPPILLAIAAIALLGPSSRNAPFAIAVVGVPAFGRVLRACALSEKPKDYVLASRACGATDLRILFRGILPNCVGPLMVQITIMVAWAIVLESALSFLGLGAQPPEPSWGTMLRAGYVKLRIAPWYGVVPGVAICLLLSSVNSLADSLRDALDPSRLRSI